MIVAIIGLFIFTIGCAFTGLSVEPFISQQLRSPINIVGIVLLACGLAMLVGGLIYRSINKK